MRHDFGPVRNAKVEVEIRHGKFETARQETNEAGDQQDDWRAEEMRLAVDDITKERQNNGNGWYEVANDQDYWKTTNDFN